MTNPERPSTPARPRRAMTPPAPPSQRTEQVIPPALEHIILRCLAKDPRARPPSVGALSSDLEALAIEDAWTDERARDWWRVHPSAPALEPSPRPDPDPSRDETLSQDPVPAPRP